MFLKRKARVGIHKENTLHFCKRFRLGILQLHIYIIKKLLQKSYTNKLVINTKEI